MTKSLVAIIFAFIAYVSAQDSLVADPIKIPINQCGLTKNGWVYSCLTTTNNYINIFPLKVTYADCNSKPKCLLRYKLKYLDYSCFINFISFKSLL
jgi:hypothetical protein